MSPRYSLVSQNEVHHGDALAMTFSSRLFTSAGIAFPKIRAVQAESAPAATTPAAASEIAASARPSGASGQMNFDF